MKKRLIYFLLPIIALVGLLFASSLTYAEPSTDSNSSLTAPNESTEDSADESSTAEKPQTCYDQVGAIGWLICPTTGALAKGIDSVYSIIQSLVQVNPISTDQNSPIYLVWEYTRNITNIIFIIFILIVIYSQLTGFGITNYGIKKVLPRIIIAAILVNLSFIICALAVDVSNILGSSLRGVFTNIQDITIANGSINSTANISVGELTAGVLGTAAVGTGATIAGLAIAGGTMSVIWMLMPVIFAGIISVITALVTLAARQALIMLLIMISPLAFVAYLLPNTESWFKKWYKLLLQMLVFYPMFSVLYGASQLAGWTIITSATNWFGVVLGIAVQILPLFFSLSLMKMSKTLLGSIGQKIDKLTAGTQKGVGDWAGSRRNIARAEHESKKLRSGSPSLTAFLARRRSSLADRQQKATENSEKLLAEQLDARRLGARIIGYDKNGKPLYSRRPIKQTREMKREYENREIKLRAQNASGEVNNAMNTMGDYLKNNNIDTRKGLASQIKALTERQADNYLDSVTIQKAAARNDLSDKRFYYDTVLKAQEQGPNSKAYQKFIVRGAGADGLSSDNKIRDDARTGVVADAYDMFEAERRTLVSKYTTFYSKQKTLDVLKLYDSNLNTQNIDAISAAHEVLAFRGDFDKIGENLQKYMDQRPGYVELGTDFANTLASSLLNMKDKDPALARLGKHINMETWRYSNDNSSRSKNVTMKEYVTGIDDLGIDTKTGGMVKLLEGTSLKGIERTAFGNIKDLIKNGNYFTAPGEKEAYEKKLTETILPQIITAIPTFETNGEQIMNTLSYITGLKNVNGQWVDHYTDPATGRHVALAPRVDITEKYLRSLTSNDLINLKTNAFQATLEVLKVANGGDENRAKDRFKQIQQENGNLAKLLAFEPNVLAPMKDSVFQVLGIPLPPRSTS